MQDHAPDPAIAVCIAAVGVATMLFPPAAAAAGLAKTAGTFLQVARGTTFTVPLLLAAFRKHNDEAVEDLVGEVTATGAGGEADEPGSSDGGERRVKGTVVIFRRGFCSRRDVVVLFSRCFRRRRILGSCSILVKTDMLRGASHRCSLGQRKTRCLIAV